MIAYTLPEFEIAKVKALDFTKRTGLEYGLVLNAQKGIIGEEPGRGPTFIDKLNGIGGTVAFTSLQNQLAGNWVVHTHPINAGLSMQDLIASGLGDTAGVIAVTPDGSVYAAHDLVQTDLSFLQIQLSHQTGHRMADTLMDQTSLTLPEVEAVTSHYFGLQLARAGVIQYEYDLGDFTRAAWAKYEHLEGGGHKYAR